jgi:dipeptidyl aminopeptidase/acylaminoacyl peptidase
MPRRTPLAVLSALVASLALATGARADVIDYNPVTTEPPQILTPEELAKYDQLLRVSAAPEIVTSGMVPGQHVLVRVGMQYQVLDTTTEKTTNIDLTGIRSVGAMFWTGPGKAVAYGTKEVAPNQVLPHKLVFDLAAGTLTATPITLPTIEGKQLFIQGRLVQTADGRLHVLAYTNTRPSQLTVVEEPIYDPRSPAERAAQGQSVDEVVLAANPEDLLAISIDDGTVTRIGTVPAGSNVAGALASVSVRPGTNVAAYTTARDVPWTGIVVGGRANRGGFMPTSYFSTQENLGRVPESENRWLTGRRLVFVDLSTGTELKVVENADQPGGRFGGTFWTADGQHLVVVTAIPSILQGRAHPIYEYSAGVKLRLYAPDGRFKREWRREGMDNGTSFAPAGGSLLLAINPENLSRSVYLIDLSEPNAAPMKVYDGSDQVYLNSIALVGDRVVVVRSDVTDPGNLYVGDAGAPNAELHRLTDVNAALRQVSNIKFEPVKYRTSSGFEVTGIYAYPGTMSFPPSRPMPLVVWQEGGPGGQMTNGWRTSVEGPHSLLPNYGIPMFIVNGAGRNSNGAAFYSAMADARNFGTRDILDVKEGVEHLIAQGIVDPEAVGVTGCSYGGYFTLQSITQLPDFYAAANAQCSLNEVMWEYNFGWSPFLAYLVGTTTTADPAEYIHDSPMYGAHRIKTPLLLFHGTADFLPFEHITNIHDQVAAIGTPTRFLRAYGRGHGFGRLNNTPEEFSRAARAQRYAFQLQLDWFRTHLGLKDNPRLTLTLPGLRPGPVGAGPLR